MENIIIDINNDVAYPSFIISGRFNELLNNKRLSLSFNRLNVSIENESFKIPYREESQVVACRPALDQLGACRDWSPFGQRYADVRRGSVRSGHLRLG